MYKNFIDQSFNSNNIDFLNELKGKIYNDYYYLPSNLFLEDSETFINTEGVIKRTTKAISFKKNAKSNWQIIRKIYLKTKFLMLFNQKKDINLVNIDSINPFTFKNYLMFHFYAVQTFTNFSFYLIKQNSPYFKYKLKSDIKKPKTKIYFTKLKNWLDDFFTDNGKDSFSYNSSVLMNCSKILRVSSTNFF
jgi:predicted molibdopterin-dependent oxidoreductase YjgC